VVKYCQFQFCSNTAYSVDFMETVQLTQSAHTASVLECILCCAAFMKLHPQEVLASNATSMVRKYAMFKQD